jgi:hypothetical protein
MLITLTEAVCPSDLEDCALTYRESRVALFARRKLRSATSHPFYKVQRAYCCPSIIVSGARSSARRVCPRKLDRHFHLLAENLVVLSPIAAYAEAENRCTKMSHSVYLACNGLVITVTQEYDQ